MGLKLVLVCGLFVIFVMVPFSLGRMSADNSLRDNQIDPSCMITTESGTEVCLDDATEFWQTGSKPEAQPAQSKILGGDIPAARSVVDPHPAFVGVAVDPINDIVVMADTNRKSVVSYERSLGASKSGETSEMRRQIIGPETNIGFVAGVAVDSGRREHYAVNNVEKDRQKLDARVSERMLHEYWLPHFRDAVVEGKAQSLMASYNAINGTPNNINHWLLTDLLKNEWRHEGFVVSDLGGVNTMVNGHFGKQITFTDAVARVTIGVDRPPEEAALLDDLGDLGGVRA